MTFLNLLLKLLGITLPDWNDSAAVRKFVQVILGIGQVIAERIPGDVDDRTVLLFTELVRDDEAWAAIYGYMDSFGSGAVASPSDQPLRAALLARKPGMDIATIIELVKALIELLKELGIL